MTISSDPTSAIATLETLRIIRDELHGHSILGVSNISFGLPQRPITLMQTSLLWQCSQDSTVQSSILHQKQ